MTIDGYGHLLQATYDEGLSVLDDLFAGNKIENDKTIAV